MDFKPIEFTFRTPDELDRLITWAKAQKRLVYGEIEISPAMASHMLDPKLRHPSIRNIGRADLDGYIRDMDANAWDHNGAGSKFDRRGRLFDGQKRLTAITISGRTVRMMIFFNAPRRNVNGEQREGVATRMNLRYRSLAASIGTCFEREKAGLSIFDKAYKPTPREIEIIERTYGEELVRLATLLNGFGPAQMARHAAYGWLAKKLERKAGREHVKEFFTALAEGADRGSPIAKLRNRLIKDKAGVSSGKALELDEKVWLIARTFVAWMKDENLGKLTLPKIPITMKSILELLKGF